MVWRQAPWPPSRRTATTQSDADTQKDLQQSVPVDYQLNSVKVVVSNAQIPEE